LAKDVAQQVFAKLAEVAPNGVVLCLQAWLSTCARNFAIDEYRRRARNRKRVRPLERDETAAGPDRTPDEIVEEKEERELLRDCIEKLPEDERNIVKMHVYQHMTFQAIADELGMPLATVWGKYQRLPKQLQAKWGKQIEEPDNHSKAPPLHRADSPSAHNSLPGPHSKEGKEPLGAERPGKGGNLHE
jgi:RNA polymerase sigma-70 factor (ECF subfamily)